MNKIGLVSYHREPNYGTMLQAYALAKVIKNLGKECEYINYFEMVKRSPIKDFLMRIAKYVYRMLGLPDRYEFDFFNRKEFKMIRHRFEVFHSQYIPFSKTKYYYNTIYKCIANYNCFIVGSDQTWSKAMNENPYTINFLDFVKDRKAKRSYAPSIGTIHIDEEYKKRLVSKLADFAYLSCRERPNSQLIAKELGQEVRYVVDPTLLLKPEDWDKVAKDCPIKGDYILAYILGTKKCISDYAEQLGKSMNLPVIYILTRPEYLKKQTIVSAGPAEFISLIKSAKYVITDSFHGTIFSINYGVNFYSFAKRSSGVDNDRIFTFLKELKLENRFREDNDVSIEKDIDYNVVQYKLTTLRQDSFSYLQNIIK